MKNTKFVLTAAACALSLVLVQSVQAAPADADTRVITTAPQDRAAPPAPPAPPAAGQPQGFGPEDMADVRPLPPRPEIGPDGHPLPPHLGFTADRPQPPLPGPDGRPQPPRPGMGPDGRPGPGAEIRPIIVAPGPGYAGWHSPDCARYNYGYCPRWEDHYYDAKGDRAQKDNYERSYRSLMSDALNDERYQDLVTEIAKLEDLLYIEQNVLRGMQQQTDVKSTTLRTQAKNVVELKNQLDAKYDELMQQYAEDNRDALYQDRPVRRGHHQMRHHRWHYWE